MLLKKFKTSTGSQKIEIVNKVLYINEVIDYLENMYVHSKLMRKRQGWGTDVK